MLRKLIRRLHRWLGITSGAIVLVLCVSGCTIAFEQEIREWLEPYRDVQHHSAGMLPPSELKSIAERQLPGEVASRVIYEGPARAAQVQFGNRKTPYYKLVTIDPYDAGVLKTADMNRDFLHILFSLHYRLWMRPDVGTTIVDTATLVFLLVLLTGLVNWWPSKWTILIKSLLVKWKSPWRRRNFDLHRALGIYAFPVLLVIAATGLVWGFSWFDSVVYWLVSGGESRPAVFHPSSKPPLGGDSPEGRLMGIVDAAWTELHEEHSDAEQVIICLPANDELPIRFVVNPERSTYYQTDHYYIDQHTGEQRQVQHSWGKYEDAAAADVVRRANYDIHVGTLLGLPGKAIVFTTTLIGATLPVTGLLIWRGRGRHAKRRINEDLPVGRASSAPGPADSQAGSLRHGATPNVARARTEQTR